MNDKSSPHFRGTDEEAANAGQQLAHLKQMLHHKQQQLHQAQINLNQLYQQIEIKNEEWLIANEKFQYIIEELQASNDELQNINEKLEIAQEELRVSNEALAQVNTELETKILQLTVLNNELEMLVAERTKELVHKNEQLQQEIAERQQTENALRDSELSLRTLFEETLNPILVVNEQAEYVDANKAALTFLDCSLAELTTKTVWDFAIPGQLAQVRENHSPFMSRRIQEVDYWVNQQVKTLLLNVVPMTVAHNSLLYGIGLDITEQKRARERLAHRLAMEELVTYLSTRFINLSVDQLEKEIEQALEMIGQFAQVDYCYINLFDKHTINIEKEYIWSALEVASLESQFIEVELTGLQWSVGKLQQGEIIHVPRLAELPPAAAPEKQIWEQFGVQSLLTIPLIIKNGLIGVLGFTMVRAEKDWLEGDIKLLKLMTDIFVNVLTRQQTEVALRKSEKRFRTVSDLISDYAYSLSVEPDGTILLEWSTDGFIRDTGHDLEEKIADAHHNPVIHPADKTVLLTRMERLLNNQEDVSEYRILTKQGEIRWLRDYGYPIWDETAGRVSQIIGAAQNITERKQAEEKLRESQTNLYALINNTKDLIWSVDTNLRLVTMNTAFKTRIAHVFGIKPYLGQRIIDHLPASIRQNWLTFYQRALDGEHFSIEQRYDLPDGTIYVDISFNPIIDETNRIQGLSVFSRNITERKLAEQSLRESEEKFRNLVEQSYDGIRLIDETGRVSEWNQSNERITGLAKSEVIGQPFWEVMWRVMPPELQSPKIYAGIKTKIQSSLQTGSLSWLESQTEHTIQRPDGSRRVIQSVAFPVKTDKGFMLGGVVRDVTERKQSEWELQMSQAQFRAIWESAGDAMVLSDQHGQVLLANPAYYQLYQLTPAETIGQNFALIFPEAHRQQAIDNYREQFDNAPDQFNFEGYIDLWNGKQRYLEIRVTFLTEDSQRTAMLSIIRNATERKQTEEALRESRAKLLHDSLHDDLTGLPNRKMFTDYLQRAIERANQQDDYLFAVLFLDMNRFKLINDSLGHRAGDELLIAVAQRLQSCLSPNDIVARFAGDEFIVLLNDLKQSNTALQIAHEISTTLAQPIILRNLPVFITASLGVALNNEPFKNAEELLHRADTAMYAAKRKPHPSVELFTPNKQVYHLKHLQLESQLWQAIEQQEFVLHYQPIVSLTTNRISSLEALVRWRHPQRGLLYPNDFLPIAEETGLIIQIDQWVVQTACAQAKMWHDAGYDIQVAINLSIPSLQQPFIVGFINQVIQEIVLPIDRVYLEISERATLSDLDLMIDNLQMLHQLNFKLSLDDFGAGHSSLKYLERLSLNAVKIDQSFIQNINIDAKAETIISSVIRLAHQLNLLVIAEGVELDHQLDFLRYQGCTHIQGFLFSRAILPEMVFQLFARELKEPPR